jgi:hypothetical protein
MADYKHRKDLSTILALQEVIGQIRKVTKFIYRRLVALVFCLWAYDISPPGEPSGYQVTIDDILSNCKCG